MPREQRGIGVRVLLSLPWRHADTFHCASNSPHYACHPPWRRTLQYYFWWYDIVLHFLGGLWVALAFQWYAHLRERLVLIIPTICVVLIVGIGWEAFELMIGAPREDNFMFDTSLDILMDVLGGVVGYAWASFILAKISPK
jgi:predicted membrane-bound spermidine synthase